MIWTYGHSTGESTYFSEGLRKRIMVTEIIKLNKDRNRALVQGAKSSEFSLLFWQQWTVPHLAAVVAVIVEAKRLFLLYLNVSKPSKCII